MQLLSGDWESRAQLIVTPRPGRSLDVSTCSESTKFDENLGASDESSNLERLMKDLRQEYCEWSGGVVY